MTGAHKNMNRPVNSKNQLSLSKLSRDDIYTQKYRSRAFLVTGGDARTKNLKNDEQFLQQFRHAVKL